MKEGEIMKKVLWVSRHEMTEAQKSDLKRIIHGDFETHMIRNTIKNVSEITKYIAGIDIIAAVLPARLMSELLKEVKDVKIIQSVSKRIEVMHNENGESEFLFVHDRWEQVIKLDIELKLL